MRRGKILWGTDTPFPNVLMPLKEWVDVRMNPGTEITFTPEEMETIASINEKELFKL